MIELGDKQFNVVLDSGVLGINGWGWPPEWLAILLRRLRPRELAVITKTFGIDPITGNYRWWKPWETVRYLGDGIWVNNFGLSSKGIDAHEADLEMFCRRVGVPIFSILPPLPEKAGLLAYKISGMSAKPAAIEVNLSCPNHAHSLSLGQIADSLSEMRRMFKCPYVLKFGPSQDYLDMLERLYRLHEIAHGINTAPWDTIFPSRPSPVDLSRQGRHSGKGSVSGPIIYPYAKEFVTRLRAAGYNKPIIAGGGVDSVEKALELRSLGADAIAVGTAVHFNPGLAHQIAQALQTP